MFFIDEEKRRIVKMKPEYQNGMTFDEAYVDYSIAFADIDNLVETLKENGNIKQEIKEIPAQTIYDSPEQKLYDIMNKQAGMLDRQLGIIETMLSK